MPAASYVWIPSTPEVNQTNFSTSFVFLRYVPSVSVIYSLSHLQEILAGFLPFHQDAYEETQPTQKLVSPKNSIKNKACLFPRPQNELHLYHIFPKMKVMHTHQSSMPSSTYCNIFFMNLSTTRVWFTTSDLFISCSGFSLSSLRFSVNFSNIAW